MAVEWPRIEMGSEEPISRHPVAARPLLAQIAAKHPPTYHHLCRVSVYAETFATHLKLSRTEVRMVSLAALLHDVGKLEIEDAILTKPGRLADQELEVMCRHADLGAQLLARTAPLAEFAGIVRHHHEWYNGQGYPAGLAGEQIPWIARLISVCDAFDTMTTPRPYAKAMPVSEAVAELERGANVQFDPELVRQFVERFRNVSIGSRVLCGDASASSQRPESLASRRQRQAASS